MDAAKVGAMWGIGHSIKDWNWIEALKQIEATNFIQVVL